MSDYISDPIERMNMNMERMMDLYVEENICMCCQKKVDHELYCMSPLGDGPAVCAKCAGIEDYNI